MFEGLEKKVAEFKPVKIMIFGDVMLDKYRKGIVKRISQEAPVLILEVKSKSYVLGGAGNTAVNIRHLGAVPCLVGIVGLDPESGKIQEEMIKLKMDYSGVLFSSDTAGTILKERNVAEGHQLLRVDENDRISSHENHDKHILARFYQNIENSDIVVISDYAKGTLSESVISEIVAESNKRGKKTVIDPKPKHANAYFNASFIKLNYIEGSEIAALFGNSSFKNTELTSENATEIGSKLSKELSDKFKSNIVLTLSQYGVNYCPLDSKPKHFYTFERQVSDVSGAGDTVAATLAVSLANGLMPEEAVYLANHAGGVKVQKSGVQPVNWQEIFEDIKYHNSK